MRKTKSFRTKLWLYFILFTAIIFFLLWLLQTVFLQSFYNGMLEKRTFSAMEQMAADGVNDSFTDTIDNLAYEDSLLVFVTDENGSILYSSDSYKSYYHQDDEHGGGENNPYRKDGQMNWQIGAYRNLPDGYAEFLQTLQSSEDGTASYKTDSKYICGKRIQTADGNDAILYVSVTLGAALATASIIRTQLLWVTILSLLIAFAIAYYISKKFSVPISQLSEQAKMLGEENYKDTFQKGFCSELDNLDETLHVSSIRLQEARTYQKELLANVSHDLRTPLTMIKGYAEMVRDVSWNDDAKREADLDVIVREADRLTSLVNEIMEYSQLASDDFKSVFTDVNMSRVTNRVLDRFTPLFEKEGGVIERSIEEGLTVTGNEELLERIVYNLVDNAIRHTGESKKMTVSLVGGNNVCLEVCDYGDGIAEEELPHIWEKYYTSRQRGHKGVSGLGLAIVKQIAAIHGAETSVESKSGAGSTFRILLKKK
ncbi:MAG: ATP-binding protein [Eubacteriales bacterium]|nr:ATP-binding protein [Eubacteriales bacterium]